MKGVSVPSFKTYIDERQMSGFIGSDLVRDYLTGHEVDMPLPPVGRFTLRWPVAPPAIVTQAYGIHKQWYIGFGLEGHEGLDIRALNGTPVFAMADGVVSLVQPNPASGPYGVQVRLKHQFGQDEYTTVYAHFTKESIKVAQGEVVPRGKVLGLADNTGNSSGAHLHITLKHTGKGSPWMHVSDIVNPTPYFPDLFPGKGWLVDVGGNLRSGPDETFPILRWVPPSSVPVQALDFGGEGGDWWKIRLTGVAGQPEGYLWNPGYKLRAVA
jgi:murein DD-endopeptidase MepM/ murein hydrolase activator NlpD